MPDYKKLYFQLFHVISDAIEILQQGQMEAERIIIECEPSETELADQGVDGDRR